MTVEELIAGLEAAGLEATRALVRQEPGAAAEHDQALAELREVLLEAGCDLGCPHLRAAGFVGAVLGTGSLLSVLGIPPPSVDEARSRVLATLAAAVAELREATGGTPGPPACAAPGGGEE